jgi:hypothetical protein
LDDEVGGRLGLREDVYSADEDDQEWPKTLNHFTLRPVVLGGKKLMAILAGYGMAEAEPLQAKLSLTALPI